MKYRFYNDEKRPLHVVGKCSGQHWPGKDQDEAMSWAWQVFSENLQDMFENEHVITNAFVLMSNHYHWICTYDFEDDPSIFEWFHELACCRYLHSGYFDGYVFQEEAHVEIIENFKHYQQVYKYVYRNPVTADICDNVLDYKYSTLRQTLGHHRHYGHQFTCFDNMNIITNTQRSLAWLNSNSKDELWLI